jgi:hypothetical protein
VGRRASAQRGVSGVDDLPISLILDTSAVLAFAAGSMHVHEPVIVAGEAGEHVGVPVICMLEAVRHDPRVDLREMLHHPRITVITPDPADENLLLDWTLYYDGREDCAAVAVASYQRGRCCVLTAEPDRYLIGGRRPDWVIPIDGKSPPDY